MSQPFDSGNNTFRQPLVGPSGAHGSVRPIVSAAAAGGSGPFARRDSLPLQRPRPPKRSNITPVACQPCQQRKHKVSSCSPVLAAPQADARPSTPQCDGARPVCTPCVVKKRSDCTYDAAGDQRRTSSLKQRIRDLETQVDDLKDIITGIGCAGDSNAAAALAHQLAHARFRTTAEVARSLRRDDDLQSASTLATVSEQTLKSAAHGDVSAPNASEASPSSVATGDSIEFDGFAETPAASWAADVAHMDPALWQDGTHDASIEVGGQRFHCGVEPPRQTFVCRATSKRIRSLPATTRRPGKRARTAYHGGLLLKRKKKHPRTVGVNEPDSFSRPWNSAKWAVIEINSNASKQKALSELNGPGGGHTAAY